MMKSLFKMVSYAVIFCALTACATAPVIKQAREQAEANKLISASLDDRLITYYAIQNCAFS